MRSILCTLVILSFWILHARAQSALRGRRRRKPTPLQRQKTISPRTALESPNRTRRIGESRSPAGFLGGWTKAWVLVSDFNTPHICHDGKTYEIRFPIPESLTGPTYHADTLWSLLQSKVSKDNNIVPTETLLTPAGDFLVDLSYGVKIFAIKRQGIEPKPALSAPTNPESNVVMAQWALGKHVRKWESDLQSLQKTHLHEATVATGSRQGSN